jgi:hypothetical protein
MLEFDGIPPLRGPRPQGAERVRRHAPAATAEGVGRRSMLGGALAAGTTAGLVAVGVFAPARKAMASGYTLKGWTPGSYTKGLTPGYYDIYNACPSYASSHNCSPGCGPSTVVSTACRTSGTYKGYHKSGVSDPGKYKLRPNQCYAGKYDGWIWHYANPCGNCKTSVTWRCHDGWKKSATGSWYKSICRWAHACS